MVEGGVEVPRQDLHVAATVRRRQRRERVLQYGAAIAFTGGAGWTAFTRTGGAPANASIAAAATPAVTHRRNSSPNTTGTGEDSAA